MSGPRRGRAGSGAGGPERVDRLVIHQWDATHPSPGGIDTCLRGMCRYAPAGTSLAVVGVDATGDPARVLGHWERHDFGPRSIWFMPVTRLDSGDQVRRVPHSLRVSLGASRFRARMPRSRVVQAHRMDTALYARSAFRRPLAYFVHNQDSGLVGRNSDSVWRHFGATHRRLERSVVRSAASVVVFNPDYAEVVREWNPRAVGSPTWFDPAVFAPAAQRNPYAVVWVGRIEAPKDPLLALRAFTALVQRDGQQPWTMTMVGAGTLDAELAAAHAALPADVRTRVELAGRLLPGRVAELMATGGSFLMTSHPGYEGFPRSLVEAMASGLVPVVTDGADTGRLVGPGVGAVCGRDPEQLAGGLRASVGVDRTAVRARVEELSAEKIVPRILVLPEEHVACA